MEVKDEDVKKIIHYAMLLLELDYGYDAEKISKRAMSININFLIKAPPLNIQ